MPQDAPDFQNQVLNPPLTVLSAYAIPNGNTTLALQPATPMGPGYKTLIAALSGSPNLYELALVGDVTGDTFNEWTVGVGNELPTGAYYAAFESGVDDQISIVLKANAAGGILTVYAVPDVLAPLPGNVVNKGGPPGLYSAVMAVVQNGGSGLATPWIGDASGTGFIVPCSPASQTGTYMPNPGVLYCCEQVSATTVIANAAGAGKRYRVWSAITYACGLASSGTPTAELSGLTPSVNVCRSISNSTNIWNSPPLVIPVNGIVCPTNTEIELVVSGAGGSWGCALYATEETA